MGIGGDKDSGITKKKKGKDGTTARTTTGTGKTGGCLEVLITTSKIGLMRRGGISSLLGLASGLLLQMNCTLGRKDATNIDIKAGGGDAAGENGDEDFVADVDGDDGEGGMATD